MSYGLQQVAGVQLLAVCYVSHKELKEPKGSQRKEMMSF